MDYISVNYAIKYELSFAPEYIWTENNICINCKTNRQIKQVYNSRCIGYNIRGKFYSLKYLRDYLQKPIKTELPF